MKPGQRRLLIPGLLIALLVVVVLAAAVRRADAQATPIPVVAHTQVSTIDDGRVTESSGLAASLAHPGIVYTVNDSGDAARVFAVDIESGAVVGVTTVRGARWSDAEAMALRDGKIWVADVGANRESGQARALYAFDEPGRGNHQVSAERFPITLDLGDVKIKASTVELEALVVLPGRIALFSKSWPNSRALQLSLPLTTSGKNVARLTPVSGLAWATDATATPDGRYVLLHGPVQVDVHDAQTWKLVHTDAIPILKQGETITVEASGRSYLIGSEGSDSPLVRVRFDPAGFGKTPPAVIDPLAQQRAQRPVRGWLFENRTTAIVVGALGGAALVGTALALLMKGRRTRRANERRQDPDGN